MFPRNIIEKIVQLVLFKCYYFTFVSGKIHDRTKSHLNMRARMFGGEKEKKEKSYSPAAVLVCGHHFCWACNTEVGPVGGGGRSARIAKKRGCGGHYCILTPPLENGPFSPLLPISHCVSLNGQEK